MAITNLETSSVQLRRHTGSAGVAPSTDIMLEGEFAVNLIDGHLYYGGLEGNSISSSFTFTDLLVTHSTQISGSLDIEVDDTNITGNLQIDGHISASGVFTGSDVLIDGDLTVIGTGSFDVLITNYQSSSIIYASGSTKFGDTSDDTHEFTGSVYISGSEFNIDNDFFYKPDSYSLFSSGSITASYDISASNTIYASDLDIANSVSISGDLEVRNITSSGYISSSNTIYSKNFEVVQDITASNNISASNTIYTNYLEVATDVSISGDISASGLLYEANTSPALLFVDGDISSSANISASGMLTVNNITATGNITASGDISSSANVIAAGGGIFASAKVEDLTNDRVVIVGSGGELEDDGNFTFDGNELNVVASLFVENSITASNDISASNTIYTNNIEIRNDLSASNISASGYISSSGAVFDGDITVIGTGSFDVLVTNYSASTIYASGSTKFGDTSDDTHIRTGSMFISGGLFVDNSITASSDISASNLFITNISSSGYISASSYILTNNITASGNISASGDLLVNNITASNDISASETIYANNLEVATDVSISGDISASGFLYDAAIGTPSLYVAGDISSSANISASGHISSSLLNVGSAAVTDLTNNRVVIVGSGGELEDDGNFTFDGDELNVKKSVFVENSITASNDISASGTIYANNLEVAQDITASNNISASKTIYANNLEVTTDVSTSGDITARYISASGFSSISDTGSFYLGTHNVGEELGGFLPITGSGIIVSRSFDDEATHHNMVKIGDTELVDISGSLASDSFTINIDSKALIVSTSELNKPVAKIGGSSNEVQFYKTNNQLWFNYSGTDLIISPPNGISLTGTTLNLTGTTTTINAPTLNLTSTNLTFDGNELNVDASLFVENSITASTDISASNTISASDLYASAQGTFESANVKDISSTHIVYAGTNGELQGSPDLTFAGNEVTINGNLDVQSITSSVAISGSHISSSGMDIIGNVNILGTVSASGIEGAIYYTTKSEEFEPGGPIHNLATYRVVNFNPEIFITSSGGELIIQFGEPLTPTNLSALLNGFNTNRFTGPGPVFPPTSTYVYDNYNVSFTYTLDESNTFLSASLLSMSDGAVIEISKSEAGDGSTTNSGLDYTTTFYIDKDNTGYSGGATSGSQKFTASVHVTLQDESKQSFNFVDTDDDLVGTLNKTGPGNTRVNYSYAGMNNSTTYVSNNGSTNTSNKVIEEGETGTFTYKAVVASSLNGWNNTSLNPSSNTIVTVTATSTHTLDHEANYDSNGLGSPTNFSGNPKTTTNSFTRTQSLRYGISPTTQTGSGGFTEAELRNLDGWTGGVAIEDGQIDFIANATSNNYTISNNTISMTSTAAGFIYIAYRASHADLTEIRQGATDVTSQYSVSTVGNYKVYKSNSVQSAGTFTFILNP